MHACSSNSFQQRNSVRNIQNNYPEYFLVLFMDP
jgi:hypothetical protein